MKAKKENQLRRAYVRAPQLVFFFRLHPFTRPPQVTRNQRTMGEDFAIFPSHLSSARDKIANAEKQLLFQQNKNTSTAVSPPFHRW